MKVLRDPQIISGFYFKDPVKDLPGIIHCGEALYCDGHHLAPEAHDGCEFVYLSRGNATWQLKNRIFTQAIGDVFIFHPREVHQSGPKRNPENHHLWVELRLEQLGEEGARLASLLKSEKCHLLQQCHEVEFVLRGLIGQVVSLRPIRRKSILAYLRTFMILIEQKILIIQKKSSFRQVLPYSYTVQKAVCFMQQNLDRRLPLRDVASVATTSSVPHLCTRFLREVGISPAAYHLRLRLDAAREALKHPDSMVTMVAMQYGFSSSQHFSTLFHRSFGTTPRRWQIKNRPDQD